MEWMYKPAVPSHEDYLLGRKVDKHVEGESNPDETDQRGAIFNERIKANIEMDMAAKRREDPLFQIRQREEDARKRLLQNPVKMKQLQTLIAQREKEKKREKHKTKKKKKDKHSKSGSDDDEIMEKYLAVLRAKHERHGPPSDSSKDDSHLKKGRKRSPSSSDSQQSEGSDSSESHTRILTSASSNPVKQYGLTYPTSHSSIESTKKARRPSPESHHPDKRDHKKSRDSQRNEMSKHRISQSQGSSKHHRSPERDKPKKKLSQEEKAARLQEMMDNAKWRETMRSKNVERYKGDDVKEEREKDTHRDAKFIKSMMVEHAARSSVEDRIKRNMYNVQRRQVDLEKAFTRR